MRRAVTAFAMSRVRYSTHDTALPDGTYYWKVRALDEQNNESSYSQVRKFTIDTSAPTVTASPPGGTYVSPQLVTLTAIEPATIYYTIDGSMPTTGSTVYSAPISLTANAVLKFFAVDSAGNGGPISTETYSLATTSASPSGGTYNTPQMVTLSSWIPNATIYYTIDGSEPTINSTVYSAPISISENTTLKFFGVDAAGNEGTAITEIYIFDLTTPTVTASPAGGIYSSPQIVNLNASEPATIYYTIDGSQPDTNSTIYTGPVSVISSTELKFFAVDSAGNVGSIMTESYVIDTVPPVVSTEPPAGLYNEPVSVILSSNEPATIYYTTDGTLPTTGSAIYTDPLEISTDTELRFFAVDSVGNAGATKSATYLFDFEAPSVTAEPSGGTFVLPPSVKLMASESATTIYYTTDGSEPTLDSTIYVSPIHVDSDTILRFFAKDLAGNIGPMQTETYVILIDTSPPVITAVPPGGSYNTPQNVTLLSDEPATIYYTTDGSEPITSSPIYSEPISISENTTLKFFGVDAAGNEGNIATQTYTFDFQPPTVSAMPTGGIYTEAQTVTLSTSEPAIIYYTIDGSTPTTSSNIYSSPIEIVSTTTLKFFAKDDVGNESPVATEVYTIGTVSFPITHMSDTTASFGLATNSGTSSHVEFVTPSSQLVGKSIDQITVKLRKTGTPTGNVEVDVFNSDLSVKKLFGTADATTIASTYNDYVFSLPNNELYTIEAGDRIGIKFATGDSNNFIAIMTDQDASDPFDGTNTYYQSYTDSWISATAKDLYMILTQTHG